MRQLSNAVVGCAAKIAVDAYSAGTLDLLFLEAGLEPVYGYGKAARVSNGIKAALAAAADGDSQAKDGVNEFVRLVAEHVAASTVGDEPHLGSPFWRLREAVRSDGFDLRVEHVRDGNSVDVRILPLDQPVAPLSEEVTALEAEFMQQGLDVALNHYRQAVTNFVDQRFEAANGQLRAMLEAVVVHFAVQCGFQQANPSGGSAISYLVTKGHLPERDGGGFVRGLWSIVHTNGPHPGTTTAGEVHFRMLTMTAAARFLIDWFG